MPRLSCYKANALHWEFCGHTTSETRKYMDRELIIKRRTISCLGHILRYERDSVLLLIIEGRIEGKSGIGRRQMTWLRNIKERTGLGNSVRWIEKSQKFWNNITLNRFWSIFNRITMFGNDWCETLKYHKLLYKPNEFLSWLFVLSSTFTTDAKPVRQYWLCFYCLEIVRYIFCQIC